MNAHDILNQAAQHMRDRADTYDKPEGERSMGATVGAFKAVTGHELTEEQGWLFMALLKAVRSQQGNYRADSYEDGAAYFALAGDYDCESFTDIIEWVREHDDLPDKIHAIFLWSQTDEGVYKPRNASLRTMLEWLDDPHNQASVTLANMIGEVQCQLYSIFDYHKRELYQREQENYL